MFVIHPINKEGNHLNISYDVFFDWAGNIYIKSNKTDKIYQILITKDNNIEFIHYENPDLIETSIEYKKMKLSTDPSSLKGKIVKNKMNEEEKEDNSEDDEDYENVNKLYPEDLDYYENNDNENDSDSDQMDAFDFSNVDTDIKIYSSDEYTAIYDTFIYNGSTQYNNLIVKSTYKGYPLPYRLLIYSSGEFIIKTIGHSYWYNQLVNNDNDEPILLNSNKDSIKL